jgi:hypothetical protein
MRSRIFFVLVTAFWLVMNYLLFRSQWGGHSSFGNTVPLDMVWNKILTAPDNSTLDILSKDERIGLGRWEVGAANSPFISSKILAQDYQPGQMTQKPTGYGLSFEGSGAIDYTNRFKFQCTLELDTNKVWTDCTLRVTMKPQVWDIRLVAAQQLVMLKVTDGSGGWEKVIRFGELQDPQALLEEFGDPVTAGLISANRNLFNGKGPGLTWEAREDRMNFGQSVLRVYRLSSLFMGQRIEIIVSRIGEILRVELPFNIVLRNQALTPSKNQ